MTLCGFKVSTGYLREFQNNQGSTVRPCRRANNRQTKKEDKHLRKTPNDNL